MVNGTYCIENCENCATVLGESWCKLMDPEDPWVYPTKEYVCPLGK